MSKIEQVIADVERTFVPPHLDNPKIFPDGETARQKLARLSLLNAASQQALVAPEMERKEVANIMTNDSWWPEEQAEATNKPAEA